MWWSEEFEGAIVQPVLGALAAIGRAALEASSPEIDEEARTTAVMSIVSVVEQGNWDQGNAELVECRECLSRAGQALAAVPLDGQISTYLFVIPAWVTVIGQKLVEIAKSGAGVKELGLPRDGWREVAWALLPSGQGHMVVSLEDRVKGWAESMEVWMEEMESLVKRTGSKMLSSRMSRIRRSVRSARMAVNATGFATSDPIWGMADASHVRAQLLRWCSVADMLPGVFGDERMSACELDWAHPSMWNDVDGGDAAEMLTPLTIDAFGFYGGLDEVNALRGVIECAKGTGKYSPRALAVASAAVNVLFGRGAGVRGSIVPGVIPNVESSTSADVPDGAAHHGDLLASVMEILSGSYDGGDEGFVYDDIEGEGDEVGRGEGDVDGDTTNAARRAATSFISGSLLRAILEMRRNGFLASSLGGGSGGEGEPSLPADAHRQQHVRQGNRWRGGGFQSPGSADPDSESGRRLSSVRQGWLKGENTLLEYGLALAQAGHEREAIAVALELPRGSDGRRALIEAIQSQRSRL